MSAREVALLTLDAVEQKGAWANGQLKKELAKAKLSRRDAALATRITLGTLQNRMLLDYYLSAFAAMKLSKMEGKVRNNLRLALYQILFLDRIPHSAAVSEAVNLTKKHGKNPRAAGMVNGVLRNMLRNLDALPSLPKGDSIETMSLQYSHPRWLVEEFGRYLPGDEVEALLQLHNEAARTTVQVNLLQTTKEALLAELQEEGVEAAGHPWLPGCLELSSVGNLEELSAFQKGDFYIQDPAAKLAVLAAAPKKDSRVLDVCAAPGGKSFTAAIAMENRGELLSCDLYPHKKTLIEAGAERLGLSCIKAFVQDAREARPEFEEGFDTVIADVPCSGLGVIRKKPEIRYKDPALMEGLAKLQGEILRSSAGYVKAGGVLLYATCTLRREENEEIVEAFLAGHKTFQVEAFTLPGPLGTVSDGMVTLWPHKLQTDGFFIAKLRRQA